MIENSAELVRLLRVCRAGPAFTATPPRLVATVAAPNKRVNFFCVLEFIGLEIKG